MNSNITKGVSIMTAVILAACLTPILFMDSSDANPGDTESDPLVWWNNTIILLPEVVAGEITDPDSEVLEPPESLVIDWGDGQSEVKEVDGYVEKGSVEILHTYENTGSYHITCTPQKGGYTYETYELFMEISGAPTVYFYDGEDEISHVIAENGYGVGAYEDNYFSKISAPAVPTKEGKTFAGWFYNGSEFDFNTVITAPTVLQAHWTDATSPDQPDTPVNPDTPDTPSETVTVTINGKEVTVAAGQKLSDIKVEPGEGQKFVGWYADKDFTVALDSDTVLTSGMHAYAKYAPAQEDKDSGTDIPIVAIIVTALGAIVAVVGLRYHPAILIVGVVVAAVGGLDIGGIISLF